MMQCDEREIGVLTMIGRILWLALFASCFLAQNAALSQGSKNQTLSGEQVMALVLVAEELDKRKLRIEEHSFQIVDQGEKQENFEVTTYVPGIEVNGGELHFMISKVQKKVVKRWSGK